MRSIKTILFGVMLLAATLSQAADKVAVVASFSILGDIVRQVGGDRVNVTALVGPDQDAHVFQPAPDDVKTVARAKLVVVNGLGFEGWLSRLIDAAHYRGQVLVASSGIAARERKDDGDAHAGTALHYDPHAWQDPSNVMVYTRNIMAVLSKLDPAGAATYERNGHAYLQQLAELDRWAQQQLAQIPADKRKIITSHDAFGYFGAHYHVAFLAPQGKSTDAEPSARDVARLIRQMKAEKIKAVFMENMSDPRLLRQISREAGTEVGGKLYPDALSAAGGDAPSYLAMMRFNIGQMLSGLRKN
ncbi:metal ABC transporter substrate-binding protein [Herbaspirillum sp. RTI4]|uniref:metal ABC transporter substrate-binding protein n=1 Tax=Herbaspirillum sp. RTI4 TaxID=3048640 RepID=UPI002AB3A106|nr:metal ABC transporter substrate-binding protein [Herbaspirillum sp. RTI4]MDY7579321.1 metal ABC transporter substrate-binding protein [Herbaspirillum sp. RTI4]MEA9980235.1 metal ABC transporter substrate-binding protein [Herbaspirillum sp. RTI4]